MYSEYSEYKSALGERPVPSIKIDAFRLLALLLRAELMMTAVDRRRYAGRAISAIMDVVRDFQIAYDFEEERQSWLRKMWGDIAVFMDLMRIIGEVNAIRIRPKYEDMTPDQMKIELFNRVAALDEGAAKWKKSLVSKRSRGTTRTDG